ncbi:MAG: BACON domain-containing protein [Bacteroidales bacterium]|nr:BACON domain-containing protein [Bacteroidales bacterium]
MKLRYIIGTLILALGVFTACEQEKLETLTNLKVDESYVSINVNGGTSTLNLKATEAWEVVPESVPEWLTISPMSGGAGDAVLSFKAEATKATNNAEVKIKCGNQTQYVNVIQYAAKADPVIMSVKEALAVIKTVDKGDGQSYNVDGEYYVKGIVSKIDEISTSYGNATYYLSDDGKHVDGEWLEVYRGSWLDGAKFSKGDEFAVGDELTIVGQLMSYKGTPETVQGTAKVTAIKKSLVQIASGAENGLDANGGEFLVKAICKGDGPAITIPDDAKSWVGVSGISMVKDTTFVSFFVAPNTEESSRKADISFTSKSGSDVSTVSVSVSQSGLQGTETNPFTVAQAIEYCNTLSGNSSNAFFVKGKISRIISGGEFGAQYGNATFYISDDGEYKGTDDKNCDKTHDFEAYRILNFGNAKWTEGQGQIAVGDEVVITGILTIYNGVSETASGKAWLYSVNGVKSGENGLGNVVSPFNSAGAKACIDAEFTGNVYVAGIISEIVNNGAFGAQYGNATFWISDDGKTKDFEAYRVLYLGNRKWVEGDTQIAVGDKVVLHGALTKFGSTYETSSGKAYIYSLNGKTN